MAQSAALPGGVIDPAPSPPVVTLSHEPSTGPSFEQQVVEIVNQERLQNGALPPLQRLPLLDTTAEGHSARMALQNFFAHCDLDTGLSPFDRMTAAGYFWNAAGENIAAGQSTPTAVMAAWMGSPGHRNNILSSSYREIGVGFFEQVNDASGIRLDRDGNCIQDDSGGPYFDYWTQNFGRRNGVYPLVINREAYSTDDPDVALYIYGAGFAQSMRLRNAGDAWSDWEPYSADRAWRLSPGSGAKTVEVEIRNASNIVIGNSDSILLAVLCSALDDILNLGPQSLVGVELIEACSMITAGQGVVVETTGQVTLRAPKVVLEPGFQVRRGGSLVAHGQVPGA